MGILSAVASAVASALSSAAKSKNAGSSPSSNPSGTYRADGSFTPVSSNVSTGNKSTGGGGSPALRDYLQGSNLSPAWSSTNPDYVSIGEKNFKVGQIPGTSYNPTTSTHYVTNANLFDKAVGLGTKEEEEDDFPTYLNQIQSILGPVPSLEASPALSHAEALSRAQGQLDPLYKDLEEKSLKAVDESNIRRGFFGQLPGAALSRSTAADIGNKRIAAINALAGEMVGQSEEGARSAQSLAMQRYNTMANMALSALSQYSGNQQFNKNYQLALVKAALDAQNSQKENERADRALERQSNFDMWNISGYYTDPTTGELKPTWEREYGTSQLVNAAARAASSGGGGLTATDIRNDNYGGALDRVKNQVDEAWSRGGWAGAVSSIPQILSNILADAGEYQRGGVDTQNLVDYLYNLVGGFTKQNGQWTNQKDEWAIN